MREEDSSSFLELYLTGLSLNLFLKAFIDLNKETDSDGGALVHSSGSSAAGHELCQSRGCCVF